MLCFRRQSTGQPRARSCAGRGAVDAAEATGHERRRPARPRAAKPWLVGPLFDLVFVANLAWPAVALLALAGPSWVLGPLTALQVYFISTPHRWITLALVFLDRDRFWAEPKKFGGLAV